MVVEILHFRPCSACVAETFTERARGQLPGPPIAQKCIVDLERNTTTAEQLSDCNTLRPCERDEELDVAIVVIIAGMFVLVAGVMVVSMIVGCCRTEGGCSDTGEKDCCSAWPNIFSGLGMVSMPCFNDPMAWIFTWVSMCV